MESENQILIPVNPVLRKGLFANVNVSEFLSRIEDDTLEVESEQEVAEMILNWLKDHSESNDTMIRLLTCVRWSGIEVHYVLNELLYHASFSLRLPVIRFLCRVVQYHEFGRQFEGLRTFLRPSTGYEKCFVYLSGRKYNSTLSSVKLQQTGCPARYDLRQLGEPKQRNFGCACVLNQPSYDDPKCQESRLYMTGLGKNNDEIWMYEVSSSNAGWKKRGKMVVGRSYHCSVIVGTTLYTFGGVTRAWSSSSSQTGSREVFPRFVEEFETSSDSTESKHSAFLSKPVADAAHLGYGLSIYVFGGRDASDRVVDTVQVYDTVGKTCKVLPTRMPSAEMESVALLYDKWAIILCSTICYLYDLNEDTWYVRPEFRTGVVYFGAAMEDQTVFIFGGTRRVNIDDEPVNIESKKIRSVDVQRIIKGDQRCAWNKHGNLHQPCGDVRTSAVMTLPIKIQYDHDSSS